MNVCVSIFKWFLHLLINCDGRCSLNGDCMLDTAPCLSSEIFHFGNLSLLCNKLLLLFLGCFLRFVENECWTCFTRIKEATEVRIFILNSILKIWTNFSYCLQSCVCLHTFRRVKRHSFKISVLSCNRCTVAHWNFMRNFQSNENYNERGLKPADVTNRNLAL